MSVGDITDVQSRLRQLIPANWFPAGQTPIYDALLTGIASALSFIYGVFAYVRLQARIATATDGFLDLIAQDYFGAGLRRGLGETDNSYRARIQAGIFRERGTRKAVTSILTQLTDRAPVIFEAFRAADTGAYRTTALFYGATGGYGSTQLPLQAFITAYRPLGKGIPNVAGYGISTGGYGQASQAEYASLSMIESSVTDADIYAAVDSVRPTCATLWVHISN